MSSGFFRGVLVGVGISFVSLVGFAHAASGGLFGEILGKILGITPDQVMTYAWDGTVVNSTKLWGSPASDFQKLAPVRSCDAGKCIYGFDAGGNLLCR